MPQNTDTVESLYNKFDNHDKKFIKQRAFLKRKISILPFFSSKKSL